MKVTCDRAAVAEGLQLASAVVAVRTPKPVLQCVKLQAREGAGLTLSATDQEVSLRYVVESVEVIEPGETLLLAERINAIVHELTDEQVTIEVVEDICQITAANSQFKVFGQSVAEFPEIPTLDAKGEGTVELSAGVLRRMIRQTVFATAKEASRYAINGVLWEIKGKKLTLVGTDGRRLAIATGELAAKAAGDLRAICPNKMMHLLERNLPADDETILVRISEKDFMVRTERAELHSILVEGNFPKYDDVMPRGVDRKVELSVEGFASVVRRAALLTDEDSKGVRLSLQVGQMVLTSRAPEMGEAEVRLAIELEGEPVDIGFNPQFLLDAMRVIDGETFVLELKDSDKPGILKTADFRYVVMPVTIS
jgi:DNA polymerase-3 subunit beta